MPEDYPHRTPVSTLKLPAFLSSFSSQNKQYRAAKPINGYILGYDKPETLSMPHMSFSSGSITALAQEVKFAM